MTTTITAQMVKELADAQPPIEPRGKALAFLVVTAIFLALSVICVSLRLWFRFWKLRKAKVGGWEDVLTILGLICYIFMSAFGILSCFYGVGTLDKNMNPILQIRAAEYYMYWEISMILSTIWIKTAVGAAILRISPSRGYTWTMYGVLTVSNAMFLAGLIWALAACRPLASRWNPLIGNCTYGGTLPILYSSNVVTLITDAGCAFIPVFMVRHLTMPRRTKLALMAVLGMGGLTVLIALIRFAFIPDMNYHPGAVNFLYGITGYSIMAVLELGIGLMCGSLPTLGKMFNLYDRTTRRMSTAGLTGSATVRRSIGGTEISGAPGGGGGGGGGGYHHGSSPRKGSTPRKGSVANSRRGSLALVPFSKGSVHAFAWGGGPPEADEEALHLDGIFQRTEISIMNCDDVDGTDGSATLKSHGSGRGASI